jgi:mannose-6-phosphate isomerase-like protein (cupin superfamily)
MGEPHRRNEPRPRPKAAIRDPTRLRRAILGSRMLARIDMGPICKKALVAPYGGAVANQDAPFDLSTVVVGLRSDGKAQLMPNVPGPPQRIDGFTVGAPVMTRPAPHNGEMHPDGDEVLLLISGHVSVLLEEEASNRVLELRPGQAVIVPRGVWHRVLPNEPSQLLHITPGPGGQHRPLPGNAVG